MNILGLISQLIGIKTLRLTVSIFGCRAGIFNHQTARDLPVDDFLPNDLHIVQNGPLGVSEQGQIRVVWEKEPLGFPTGLARDHHAPRGIITRRAGSS